MWWTLNDSAYIRETQLGWRIFVAGLYIGSSRLSSVEYHVDVWHKLMINTCCGNASVAVWYTSVAAHELRLILPKGTLCHWFSLLNVPFRTLTHPVKINIFWVVLSAGRCEVGAGSEAACKYHASWGLDVYDGLSVGIVSTQHCCNAATFVKACH